MSIVIRAHFDGKSIILDEPRKIAGFEPLPASVLRLKRRVVKPFGQDACPVLLREGEAI